jgi:hypothetical protein
MDLILKLIFKIFKELFEQSNQKRRAESARREERIKELMSKMNKVFVPSPPEIPPVPKPKRERRPAPQHTVTLSEKVKAAPRKPARIPEEAAFVLPGKNAKQQLILAQAILGPCKAHERSGLKRRTY